MKQLGWVLAAALFAGSVGLARADDDDNRVISRLGMNSPKDHLRIASFYMPFDGSKSEGYPAVPAGDATRFYSKVWDGLYLQVTTEKGEDGVAGYMVSFSKDEAQQDVIKTDESRDVPSLREVSAADFRTDDNFGVRALKPGPGTPSDRGALRVIHYDDFDVEIRVLEFNIGDTGLKHKPYFKNLSCLVTVMEKASANQAK
jgi:hypothetical protein